MKSTITHKLPEPSAILRVSSYTACPVETCDRCGQGIKYVALVSLKDGTAMRYGMDCINKILAGDTSLKGLFRKNEKLLAQYTATLAILSRHESKMAVDPSGYYDRGFYFIAGEDGRSITFNGRSFFHPSKVDWDKVDKMMDSATCCKTLDMRSCGMGAWEPFTRENWAIHKRYEIAKTAPEIEAKINQISAFLARIVAKGIMAYAEVDFISRL